MPSCPLVQAFIKEVLEDLARLPYPVDDLKDQVERLAVAPFAQDTSQETLRRRLWYCQWRSFMFVSYSNAAPPMQERWRAEVYSLLVGAGRHFNVSKALPLLTELHEEIVVRLTEMNLDKSASPERGSIVPMGMLAHATEQTRIMISNISQLGTDPAQIGRDFFGVFFVTNESRERIVQQLIPDLLNPIGFP